MKRCIYYICSASNLVDWGKNLLNITQVYGVISLQLLAQCISIESRYNFCVKGARMAKIDESDSLSNRTGFQRRYIYSKLLNLRFRKFALNFRDIFLSILAMEGLNLKQSMSIWSFGHFIDFIVNILCHQYSLPNLNKL